MELGYDLGGQFVSASSSAKWLFFKRYFFISRLPCVSFTEALNFNNSCAEHGSGKVDNLKYKFSGLLNRFDLENTIEADIDEVCDTSTHFYEFYETDSVTKLLLHLRGL